MVPLLAHVLGLDVRWFSASWGVIGVIPAGADPDLEANDGNE